MKRAEIKSRRGEVFGEEQPGEEKFCIFFFREQSHLA